MVFIDQMLGVFETLNAWYCPKWFKGRVQIEGLEHIQQAQAEGKGLYCLAPLDFTGCRRLFMCTVF